MSEEKAEKLVKQILAEQLGVNVEDVNSDDDLLDDLHMSPSDLSEVMGSFVRAGAEVIEADIKDAETVSDLVDLVYNSLES